MTARFVVLFLAAGVIWGQPAPPRQPAPTPPPEPGSRLARRLEWFQDQKFGFFMHWGAYSTRGYVESWPLVWADRKWSNPSIKTMEEMIDFRQKYWALSREFNPVNFDPRPWAALTKKAGMRYVVFTTKHHDGFAMFDTTLSDYKITSPDVPFSKNPRANIALAIFDAFRKQGFGVGAYYSKPDWRSPYYWKPDKFPETRNPNYDTRAEPEVWARFQKFVYGQIEELMTQYGRMDILWLDGGWVRPPNQDIKLEEIVKMARSHQPDLIVVNRAARGYFEDYRTPENTIPPKPLLDYTWESCITMARQWSYKPNDRYKSTRELIHMLVDVVSKGGNLLLNVGPQPDGRLPAEAVTRLEEIGRWMAVNSEAIHGTRAGAPYRQGQLAFTRKGDALYAIYLAGQDETAPPAQITVPLAPGPKWKVQMLGSKARIRWVAEGTGMRIEVPAATQKAPPCEHAFVFKIIGAGGAGGASGTAAH